jgi:hypothetical protein
MTQAGRHDRHGDASVEHLGRHEMAEIVETEMTESGSAAHADEALGHEVRRPGPDASQIGAEDEAVIKSHSFPVGCRDLALPSQ